MNIPKGLCPSCKTLVQKENPPLTKLTPNQLIILLHVYMGEHEEAIIPLSNKGDYADMRYLMNNGLVKYDGQHSVTPRGVERIFGALE
jgi:hypothetical protein